MSVFMLLFLIGLTALLAVLVPLVSNGHGLSQTITPAFLVHASACPAGGKSSARS
jgi:hypothetical protein